MRVRARADQIRDATGDTVQQVAPSIARLPARSASATRPAVAQALAERQSATMGIKITSGTNTAKPSAKRRQGWFPWRSPGPGGERSPAVLGAACYRAETWPLDSSTNPHRPLAVVGGTTGGRTSGPPRRGELALSC